MAKYAVTLCAGKERFPQLLANGNLVAQGDGLPAGWFAGDATGEGPLSSIAHLSRESVASMSEIVWAINPRRDHLADLSCTSHLCRIAGRDRELQRGKRFLMS